MWHTAGKSSALKGCARCAAARSRVGRGPENGKDVAGGPSGRVPRLRVVLRAAPAMPHRHAHSLCRLPRGVELEDGGHRWEVKPACRHVGAEEDSRRALCEAQEGLGALGLRGAEAAAAAAGGEWEADAANMLAMGWLAWRISAVRGSQSQLLSACPAGCAALRCCPTAAWRQRNSHTAAAAQAPHTPTPDLGEVAVKLEDGHAIGQQELLSSPLPQFRQHCRGGAHSWSVAVVMDCLNAMLGALHPAAKHHSPGCAVHHHQGSRSDQANPAQQRKNYSTNRRRHLPACQCTCRILFH